MNQNSFMNSVIKPLTKEMSLFYSRKLVGYYKYKIFCSNKISSSHVRSFILDGNPLPKIAWTYNGSPVDPAKFAQAFDGEKATLRLPITERDNQGLYKCVLTNDLGVCESASNVNVNKVYRPPTFVQKFTDQEQVWFTFLLIL